MTRKKLYPTLIGCFTATLVLASNQAFGGSAAGIFFHGPANGQPGVVVRAPLSAHADYTCTLNIPWDWPHRCPPLSPPEPTSDLVIRPNVPDCPAQTVKVPMADGKEHTVTIVRCP
jgi:hypothetical protein